MHPKNTSEGQGIEDWEEKERELSWSLLSGTDTQSLRGTLRSQYNMCQDSLHGEKGKSKDNVTISSQITLVKHSPHELLIPLLFQIVNWTRIEAKSNVTCLRVAQRA